MSEQNLRQALADARLSVSDFDAVLTAARECMARAWDEGYQLDWTGGAKWDNPYRPGGGPS